MTIQKVTFARWIRVVKILVLSLLLVLEVFVIGTVPSEAQNQSRPPINSADISFRIGAVDAELLAQEFYPEFSVKDLTRLPNYHIYLKLMINGSLSAPLSAITLPS